MSWMDYVRQHGGSVNTEIAKRVGVTPQSIGRWHASEPKPELVRAFAKAYGRPVLEAFVAAGLLTAEDANEQVVRSDSSQLSDEDLVNEVLARMRRGGSRGDTAPMKQDQDATTPQSGVADLPMLSEGRRRRSTRRTADVMTAEERRAAGIPPDVPLAAQRRKRSAGHEPGEDAE